ncbi:hypothetical protein CIW49_08575 [Mycolicibacterium sp. P1-18]|uniref:hypothetical protein n=1 Tax=Mycolicibacterium sp. P1-18 TaxID=2024615 RepID=UPI0011F2C032|nr:hypothetical protein [Mycolicibacterium sp. P1-18]KAA0099640.1 hypothetical protein CIW49_08575 [Mycolicibacterium sp. P1-18]
MGDLLALAVEAHGGLRRWDQLTSAKGRFAIAGAIWDFKGVPGVLADVTVALDLRAERVTLDPVGGDDTHTVFADGRLELRSTSGDLVEVVTDPRDAMTRLPYDTPWNAMDAAYFASEAWWTYLTAPFLFTYDGFDVEEVEPFVEAGVSHRTLRVVFPDDVDGHTAEQFFHFDDTGLLFRHTYTVDVLDGATGANYPSEWKIVDGIAVPMVRRIYGYDADRRRIPEPVLVSLDIRELRFQ